MSNSSAGSALFPSGEPVRPPPAGHQQRSLILRCVLMLSCDPIPSTVFGAQACESPDGSKLTFDLFLARRYDRTAHLAQKITADSEIERLQRVSLRMLNLT